MDVATYLARIEYQGHVRPDHETLRGLQLAHLLTVPFENLDIGLGRKIELDDQALWNKIITNHRGGFCYELNGLFAWLLKQIGFEVTYLDARDYHEDSDSFGIHFDHLALMVHAPGDTTRWLADVGYGDTFIQPLDIGSGDEQVQGLRGYRLEPFRGGHQLWERGFDGNWERQYFFDLEAHNFPSEYEKTCIYHQTSSESVFTRKRVVSRLTRDGRVSISDGYLVMTKDGKQTRRPLKSEDELRQLLEDNFGFSL